MAENGSVAFGNANNLAVQITDGYFNYGFRKTGVPVLDGININVPEGIIYGLLGPSGCGKTTLLSTVVGLFEMKKGQVKVFGEKPGSKNSTVPGRGVGYMPQELSLFRELTIDETLRYFGKLQGLDQEAFNERTKFLIQLLNLPKKSKIVGNLSGGQKRRVSLAVALIHRPPLLILDEPTVGVDPLLRQCIWNYLSELTSEGVTVIITTHYIEEAAQAHMVGLMREGKLLAETTPSQLLFHFGEATLEKCFLKLCKINRFIDLKASDIPKTRREHITQKELGYSNAGFTNENDVIHYSSSGSKIQVEKPVKYIDNDDRKITYMSKFSTLLVKNLTRIRRNMALMMFEILVPAFVVGFMCLCIGPDLNSLNIAVVNEERPALTSLRFLKEINPYILIQNPIENIQDAIESVRNGHNIGVIHIRSGFSRALIQKFREGLEASNETIINSYISVNMDYTNKQIAYATSHELYKAFQKFSRKALEQAGANPLLADSSIKFDNPIYGSEDGSYAQFVAPGIIINIVYFFALILTALSSVEERKNGLFSRSFVSGVDPSQVLLSQMLAQGTVLVVQVAICILLSIYILDITSVGSLFWVIAVAFLQGVFGMAFGLMISVMVSTENLALLIAMGTYYPAAILSGFCWPLEGQPDLLRYYISPWMPQSLPSESLRAVFYKGYDITYDIVWLGILVECIWTVVIILLSAFILRIRK